MSPSRNANLDALRGIAVLLVLGRHMDYFHLWTKIGWAGVDLFFVLSGFLISGLLFSDWKSRHAIDIKRFYIRRGLKLYPAFYALLAATVVSAAFFPSLTPFPVNSVSIGVESLFLQNYFVGVWGHTWSLAVEEHFYLALPVVLLLVQRRRSQDPFSRLPWLFAVVAVGCLLMRFASVSPHSHVTNLVRTHLRIDGLVFGVLLGYYRHFDPERFAKIARSKLGLGVSMLGIALLLAVPVESPVMHTVGFTILYLGFGFILARTIDIRPNPIGATVIRPLAGIGFYSYSIYLWHFSVSRAIPRAGPLQFSSYIAVSILFGITMAKLIEVPTLAFRDRIFPSRLHAPDQGLQESQPSCFQAANLST